MNVLVTGAAGFVGKAISRTLKSKGHAVTGLGREANMDVQDIRYVLCDVLDITSLKNLFCGEDSVFHIAGTSNLVASFNQPSKEVEVNVMGTTNVLELCRKNDVKNIIFASSSAVYGKPNSDPVDEAAPKNPTSPYAVSKYLGEQICQMYSEAYGLKCAILRFFNIYGAGDMPSETGRLIPSITYKISKNMPLKITGNGMQKRDFIHISDVTNACVEVLEKGIEGTYNIGTGAGTTVNEIVEKIGTLLERPPKIERIETSRDEFDVVSDIKRLKSQIGYVPQMSIDNGLAEYISWIKKRNIL